MEKIYFWQDKTGRGFTNNLPAEHIRRTWDKEEVDWNGDSVIIFIDDAEVGDVWENSEQRLTRIK